jgi:peptidyl-prolyl cis-trans isomerase C
MNSCTSTATKPEKYLLPEVRINGVPLDESLYAREMQYHCAENFQSARNKAAQALVIRQLLINELGRDPVDGMSASDEEEAIQALLDENVSCPEPSEGDCRRYFENNPDRFRRQPLLQLEHILVAASKDDSYGRDQAKLKALSIIEKLQANPALLPALAEEFSACPSKKAGGSLGQVGKGETVPEFEKQVMRLPLGLAESPIESRYGFHVVRVNKRIEGEPLKYGMVETKLKRYLMQKAYQLAIQDYIRSLVEKSHIEGIQISWKASNIID